MRIITKVAATVQSLVHAMAEDVAKECPIVLRRRKFSTATLAQTFILGFLAKPRASDEDLAEMAALLGVQVTAQAIEQRHTPRLADFLEALFRRASQDIVKSSKLLARYWSDSRPCCFWTVRPSPCPTTCSHVSAVAVALMAAARPR